MCWISYMTYTTQVNQVSPIQEEVEKTIDEPSEKEDHIALTVDSYFLLGGGCESLGFLRCWSCPKKLCNSHARPTRVQELVFCCASHEPEEVDIENFLRSQGIYLRS